MKLLLITLLIAISSAFSITSQQQLQTVQWPFTVCGNGTWTMKNLTLDHVVTRNANDDIDAVDINLFRLGLLTTIHNLQRWILRSH